MVICGGSGAFTELKGLRDLPDLGITAMPHTFDSGGAQALFLKHHPGFVAGADAYKCVVSLAQDPIGAKLFSFRFTGKETDGLAEHNQTVGNILLLAFEKMRIPLRSAIAYMAEKLELQPHHRVEPIAIQRADAYFRLQNGLVIRGETHIDIPQHDGSIPISETWLEPPAEASPIALEAIGDADLVVIGPGDLYSSLVPCLLPRGAKEAIRTARAKFVYVINLMTKYGETTGFKASDFVDVVERYTGRPMDFVVVNTGRPSPELTELYTEEHAVPVENNLADRPGQKVVAADLLDTSEGPARHHSERIAQTLFSLLSN